jgi:hypothetical protein
LRLELRLVGKGFGIAGAWCARKTKNWRTDAGYVSIRPMRSAYIVGPPKGVKPLVPRIR